MLELPCRTHTHINEQETPSNKCCIFSPAITIPKDSLLVYGDCNNRLIRVCVRPPITRYRASISPAHSTISLPWFPVWTTATVPTPAACATSIVSIQISSTSIGSIESPRQYWPDAQFASDAHGLTECTLASEDGQWKSVHELHRPRHVLPEGPIGTKC